MSSETHIPILRPADSTSANWQLLGTILWGIAIALVFVAAQAISFFIVVLRGQGDLSDEKVQGLVEAAQSDGTALSVATLVAALVSVPLIVGVAKLKKGSNIKDYLALKAVPLRSLGLWLAALILFIALSDVLTTLLGKPIVPEFMRTAYSSAHPRWLLWLALVVAAPLFEETFFRGFLFKGFASSLVGPVGAIAITSILWAAVHTQYEFYGIGTVFFLGVLFGLARMLSGSLLVPLTLHATANIVATVEAAFLG